MSPHGSWFAPTGVQAHKAPPPSPTPLPTLPPAPTPTPAPTATPTPAPSPTAEPTGKPKPTAAPTANGSAHTPEAEQASAVVTSHPAPSASAPATQRPAPAHVATKPAQLVQQASSVSSTLASFASDSRGALSPYVLGADVLAGVSVAGSLLLAELRRRRLV